MLAGTYDITIDQGSYFELNVTYKQGGTAVNLAGYTAAMHIREEFADDAAVIELTSVDSGGITITPASGMLLIEMTPAQTAAFTFRAARYDIELTPSDGNTFKILRGAAKLRLEATK